MDLKFIDLDTAATRGTADPKNLLGFTGDEFQWNVVNGCTEVSAGCDDCIAKEAWEQWAKGSANYFDSSSWKRVVAYDYALQQGPKSWGAAPRFVLVAPASDLFHEQVPEKFIDKVLSVIGQHPQHTFFIQTKRPLRMKKYFSDRAKGFIPQESRSDPLARDVKWPLGNVFVGVSCEDQKTYMDRVVPLLDTPADNRFVALEPMLGPVRLERIPLQNRDILYPLSGVVQAYAGVDAAGEFTWAPMSQPRARMGRIDWVMLGGYRGPKVNPMHPLWVRAVQKACKIAGVPFFFKGWGDYIPVAQPDLAGDETLIIFSHNGDKRGRGTGSATNFLHIDTTGAIPDICMSRKANRNLQAQLGTQQAKELPKAKPRKIKLTDVSDTARMLQALSNADASLAGPNTGDPMRQTQNRPGVGVATNSGLSASARMGAMNSTQERQKAAEKATMDKANETGAWMRDLLNTPVSELFNKKP